ncbi:MAG: helix-turn-helix transcriptional regulator [Chitinophagaceae bacterium]|nr:helix-turn-helix transcriptional regulator [Chitinophagaceae bacterium]
MENKELLLRQIGVNIRKIRTSNNMEPKEAARKLDISVQGYGAIENGKVDLNISRLFQIANLFKVDFSEIMNISNTTFNFTSQNNSGGYHVQKIESLNINDADVKNYFETEIDQLKKKINIINSLGKEKNSKWRYLKFRLILKTLFCPKQKKL